ncbi:MAG: hypothetical protein FD143_986 [Ignavibacteria bacterium]|nr:MAG: hypothetical protein FD143_986 [Ignavibacteria bacterium]KAF0161228.1 MAG: hypothetical protein FD188_1139 [Ignavibacteria bacterium]
MMVYIENIEDILNPVPTNICFENFTTFLLFQILAFESI